MTTKPEAIALIEADIEALLIKHGVTGERQFWFQRSEVKSAMREVIDYIAAQDAEIARLREALLRSKSLISDVYSMLPEQAIAAWQVIDKRTGAWFVFGVDSEAPTTKEPS